MLRRFGLGLFAVVVALSFFALPLFEPGEVAGQATLALQTPSFVRSAAAAEGQVGLDQVLANDIQREAGLALYVKAPTTINLTNSSLRGLFRTIEDATDTYIRGSISPLNDYAEYADAKAFIHSDGWIVVYDPKEKPASASVDWRNYSGGTSVGTKLELVLQRIAGVTGANAQSANYYHFQFPNATKLMLIGDYGQGSDEFTVTLSDQFIYDQISWNLSHVSGCCSNTFRLNGTVISTIDNRFNPEDWGTLTTGQLALGTPQTFSIGTTTGSAVLVLIYRESQ
ncbi:hypothetical protein EYB53_001485 [Candidatus Chloroploca sp. M-50]|uniref:Uncharacterized protein n=1 Tax=Candidatus Chloroploca mongolica TaxID=2528176 RepID=A0ABS4D4L0_9CHLR|nr:hypothetical protein [Candidatus Chloroploca mongolica]MBP1464368.1 hypothetical protein [Candidatus Chloroploca mongolica]